MDAVNAGDASSYDVVVIGGALAGAATATLLLRHNPGRKPSPQRPNYPRLETNRRGG